MSDASCIAPLSLRSIWRRKVEPQVKIATLKNRVYTDFISTVMVCVQLAHSSHYHWILFRKLPLEIWHSVKDLSSLATGKLTNQLGTSKQKLELNANWDEIMTALVGTQLHLVSRKKPA